MRPRVFSNSFCFSDCCKEGLYFFFSSFWAASSLWGWIKAHKWWIGGMAERPPCALLGVLRTPLFPRVPFPSSSLDTQRGPLFPSCQADNASALCYLCSHHLTAHSSLAFGKPGAIVLQLWPHKDNKWHHSLLPSDPRHEAEPAPGQHLHHGWCLSPEPPMQLSLAAAFLRFIPPPSLFSRHTPVFKPAVGNSCETVTVPVS